MAWTRLDDQFFANSKVIDLSKDAKLLYLSAVTYAAGQLTDGRITPGALRMIAALVDADPGIVRELVKAGLFENDAPDYVIHDYLEYNPTAAEVRVRRQADRERKRPHSIEGTREDSARNPNGTAEGIAADSNTPVPSPVPVVDPEPKKKEATAVAPESPWSLIEDFCEIVGMDPSDMGGESGKQAKTAKSLLGRHPRDDLLTCTRWLWSQPFWRGQGIDLITVGNQMTKWKAAGRPDTVAARASPEYVETVTHRPRYWNPLPDPRDD